MIKKYTLDRIEGDFYVFVEFPNEESQLVIAVEEVTADLTEADIVEIDENKNISVLKKETVEMKNKVQSLLEKLQNKNSE